MPHCRQKEPPSTANFHHAFPFSSLPLHVLPPPLAGTGGGYALQYRILPTRQAMKFCVCVVCVAVVCVWGKYITHHATFGWDGEEDEGMGMVGWWQHGNTSLGWGRRWGGTGFYTLTTPFYPTYHHKCACLSYPLSSLSSLYIK